jgi:hypothetical protein
MSDIQKFKKGGTPKSSGGGSKGGGGKSNSKTTASKGSGSKPSIGLPTRGARPGGPNSGNTRSYGPQNKVSKTNSTSSKGRGNPITASGGQKTFRPFRTADNLERQNKQKASSTNNNNKAKKNKKGKTSAGDNEVTLPLPGPEPSFPSFGDFSLPPLPPVRVPDRDNLISLVRPGSNEALLVSVLFEELSAVEIVKFARNDTVDGINPQYNVISNLAELKSKLDPSYLIAKQRSDTTIDGGFSIRLSDKIPAIDYLFENNIPNYVYFDPTFGESGSLIIELENIDIDEIVEVEIDTSGTIVEVR